MVGIGFTLESLLRAKYKLPRDADIVSLIEQAIFVVSHEKRKEFIKRRSSILESLFANPRNRVDSEIAVDDEVSKKLNQDESCSMKRRKLMESSKRLNEVTTEVIKKRLDQDLNVQTKLEESVKKVESRYQQIRDNKRKVQVLDVKDLPPPKSRCNEALRQRRFSNFNKKHQFIRRQIQA